MAKHGGNQGGRPAFEVTDERRKFVEAMVAHGIREPEIAAIMGITDRTLRRKFKAEIRTALAKATAKVAETVFNLATKDRNPAACFFWLKCRAGWKEINTLEHSGSLEITDSIASRLAAGRARAAQDKTT